MSLPTKSKPSATRTLGIDYGLARIGIALSDEMKIIASPLLTLPAEKKTDRTIIKLLAELEKHQKDFAYLLDEIVIGLPLKMSGKVGFQADEVKHFVDLLRQHTSVPVITWDERLTTVQAERSMREGNMSRKRRSQVIDTVAAVIILQSYLDSKNISKTSE